MYKKFQTTNTLFEYFIPKYTIPINNAKIELKRVDLLQKFRKTFINLFKNIDNYFTIDIIQYAFTTFILIMFMKNKNPNDPFYFKKISQDDLQNSFLKFNFDFSKQIQILEKLSKKNYQKLISYYKKKFNKDEDIKNNFQIKKNKSLTKIIYNDKQIIIPTILYKKLQNKKIINNDEIIFCIIIRYRAIGLYNLNQASIIPEIYNNFKINYNCELECFGSAMNYQLDNFCSLFPDLEEEYGSKGNFFQIKIKKGTYAFNPPYDIYIIDQGFKIIQQALIHNKNKITFFSFIPIWDHRGLKIIQQKCNINFYKNYDIYYKTYHNLFKSKYIKLLKMYCKNEFYFIDFLTNKKINAAFIYFIVLNNQKKINLDNLSILNIFKSI